MCALGTVESMFSRQMKVPRLKVPLQFGIKTTSLVSKVRVKENRRQRNLKFRNDLKII